ncbi:MAG: tetratricopeptide repeat protein [Desulfobacteraceae bacterium]|nr:tetratricopeptide repeat protein [Desulfobacteraceae bacterium]
MMKRLKIMFFVCLLIITAGYGCTSDTKKKEAHFQKGKAYFEKGEYKSAKIEMLNAVKIDPKYFDALETLAEIYLKLGDVAGAYKSYLKLEQLNSENIDVKLKLGTFLLLGRNFDASKKRTDAVLSKDPNNLEALFLTSGILMGQERILNDILSGMAQGRKLSEVISGFEKIVKPDAGQEPAYAKLKEEGNTDEAKRNLEQLIGQERGKKLNEAVSVFEKILSIDNKQARAHKGMAGALVLMGEYDEAAKKLKDAVNVDPKAVKPRLDLFRFYMRKKEFDLAEAEIREAIKSDPENTQLYVILGNYYVSRKDMDSAEKTFQDAIKADPGNIDLQIALGFLYYKKGDKKKAEETYLKAIKTAPEDIKPYMAAARFYEVTDNGDKALSMYKKSLELQSDDNLKIMVMNSMAKFYLKNRKADDAEQYISKILKKRPNHFPTLSLKGELLVFNRKFPEAIDVFEKLLKEEPGVERYLYFKGVAHVGKGDVRQAKECLEEVVKGNPKHVKAKLLLGDIYIRSGKYELAQKESDGVLAIIKDKNVPEKYQAYMIQGNSCMYRKQADKAEAAFKSAIKANKDNPAVYYRLGLLYRSQKKYGLAMSNFEKAMAIKPSLMDVFTNVIFIHAAKKEFDPAIKKCDEQMERVKEVPAALSIIHNLKGELFLGKNKKTEAEESFKKAIELNPNSMRAYYALARLYLVSKKEDKAIEQFKAALGKKPNQVGPHMLLGIIYETKKDFESAEKHYNEALKIKPDFAVAANNLAYLLAEQDKDLNIALGHAQKAKEALHEEPGVMDTLGWVYYKKGFYDRAIMELEESVKKFEKENATVYYHLGMAYFKKGNKKNAKQALEKALSLDKKFDGADEAEKALSEIRN